MYTQIAKNTIYNAITPLGFLASAQPVDNYARVWSRDACMTGLTGFFHQDEQMITAFQNSVLNLAKYQSEFGQIPSNISADGKVSYGTLVGRVDATTWWVIGACTLLQHQKDFFQAYAEILIPKINKALAILNAWEFNNRHFMYTPLGGNWADEYVSSGYTLYDNCLRYWAVKAASTLLNDEALASKSKCLSEMISLNFGHGAIASDTYHPEAYARKLEQPKPYMSSAFNANGFDQRWDMAGNALAMLLDIHPQVDEMVDFLQSLAQEMNSALLPVFYPIIHPADADWALLHSNFLYHFKNHPHQFHNGGAWPIFLGWLAWALRGKGHAAVADQILKNFEEKLAINSDFYEYYNTKNGQPEGTPFLCFSASGYLLMRLNVKFLL